MDDERDEQSDCKGDEAVVKRTILCGHGWGRIALQTPAIAAHSCVVGRRRQESDLAREPAKVVGHAELNIADANAKVR